MIAEAVGEAVGKDVGDAGRGLGIAVGSGFGSGFGAGVCKGLAVGDGLASFAEGAAGSGVAGLTGAGRSTTKAEGELVGNGDKLADGAVSDTFRLVSAVLAQAVKQTKPANTWDKQSLAGYDGLD